MSASGQKRSRKDASAASALEHVWSQHGPKFICITETPPDQFQGDDRPRIGTVCLRRAGFSVSARLLEWLGCPRIGRPVKADPAQVFGDEPLDSRRRRDCRTA
jgi:hypothetical protein